MKWLEEGFFYIIITFTDDYFRYDYVHLMKYKYESFEKFKKFKVKVEKQIGKHVKALRLNCGGKYMSVEFTKFLRENNIVS